MKKLIARHFAALVVAAGACFGAAGAQAANLIQNPGFENNPPASFGNNIGHPITPWSIGNTGDPNVVTVDGPGGSSYGSSGPESDASAPGAGKPQHYLDIYGDTTDIYQTVTVKSCPAAPKGEKVSATYGGAFSTRDNGPASGSITIRSGAGTGGPVLSSLTFNLPAGNSKLDPWVVKSGPVSLVRGGTYTFVARIGPSANFDNAFLRIENDPCTDTSDDGGGHDEIAQCLKLDPKVTCSADGVISVTLNGSGPFGYSPDTVDVASLTPGVSVVPPSQSLPGQTFVLSGASEGQSVTLMATAVATGAGKAEGTDLCCASKVTVDIPEGICPRKEPHLSVKKECGPVKKGTVHFPWEAQCTITVSGANLPAGQMINISELLSGIGMIGAVSSSDPWSCGSTPVSAGTPLNCSMSTNDLASAGGTSVINVTVGFAGPHDGEESRNCASGKVIDLSVLPGEHPALETEKSCDGFDQLDEPLDVKISKAFTPGGEAGPRFFINVSQVSGSLKAGDVIIVTDTVPSGAAFTSLNAPAGWSCTPAAIPPAMSAGQTLTCSYTVTSDGPLSVPALTIGAPAGVEMENCATVEVHRPGDPHGLPETDTANNTACARVTADNGGGGDDHPPRLNVVKTCEPAVQGPTGATAHCTITVTGGFLPNGSVQVLEALQVPGGQVTAISPANPSHPWTCGATPVAANDELMCSISGAALNAAGSSTLNVTVSLPANFADNPEHNRNCAAATSESAGLTSEPSCVPFVDGAVFRPPLDTGPICDKRTTVRKGRSCACRFGGAHKVSATRCACPRGTKLNPKRGRCEKIVVCRRPAFPTREGRCACPRGYRPDGRNGCRRIVVCRKPAFPTRAGKCACPRGYRPDGRNGCRRIVVCRKPAFPTRSGRCACPKGYRPDGRNGCRRIVVITPCIPPARARRDGRGCYCPRGWVRTSPFTCGRVDHPRPPKGHPRPQPRGESHGKPLGGIIPKLPF